jgi:hypothetical protein
MKPDGTLTKDDVRAFDCLWIRNNRILYATMYGGRILKVEEWSLQTRMMVCPPELAGDNVVEGVAAEPRLMHLGWGQVRLLWTAPDANGHWLLRYRDLPFYID